MNLSNYFWYFSGVLTPKFCDEVIKYALEQKDGIARTGGFSQKNYQKRMLKTFKEKESQI